MSKKNKHNESVGSEVERSDERINETGEVFTPMELCKEMVSEIPLETIEDPYSTYLDNSAGNGNFIIALRDRLSEHHPLDHVLNEMLFAVELMPDNHEELCRRVGVSTTHPHYVCADALEYDYSFVDAVGLEDHGLGMIPKPVGEVPAPPNKEPSEARLDKFF